jgi:hypothetical protein
MMNKPQVIHIIIGTYWLLRFTTIRLSWYSQSGVTKLHQIMEEKYKADGVGGKKDMQELTLTIVS